MGALKLEGIARTVRDAGDGVARIRKPGSEAFDASKGGENGASVISARHFEERGVTTRGNSSSRMGNVKSVLHQALIAFL